MGTRLLLLFYKVRCYAAASEAVRVLVCRARFVAGRVAGTARWQRRVSDGQEMRVNPTIKPAPR